MSNDPLHGITLKQIVTELVEHHGWQALGQQIKIKCFTDNPSINSSLKFLRKTEWARKKVEELYLQDSKRGSTNKQPPSKEQNIWNKSR